MLYRKSVLLYLMFFGVILGVANTTMMACFIGSFIDKHFGAYPWWSIFVMLFLEILAIWLFRTARLGLSQLKEASALSDKEPRI